MVKIVKSKDFRLSVLWAYYRKPTLLKLSSLTFLKKYFPREFCLSYAGFKIGSNAKMTGFWIFYVLACKVIRP